jgi:hypothetical protein
LGFRHTKLEKWIEKNTKKLNNFERHLRNRHTQTMRHIEALSRIEKQKKRHNVKPF